MNFANPSDADASMRKDSPASLDEGVASEAPTAMRERVLDVAGGSVRVGGVTYRLCVHREPDGTFFADVQRLPDANPFYGFAPSMIDAIEEALERLEDHRARLLRERTRRERRASSPRAPAMFL